MSASSADVSIRNQLNPETAPQSVAAITGTIVRTYKVAPNENVSPITISGECRLRIGCDATERHKPDPEPVLLALERLDARPADAIFLGDSPYDMQAGRAAGVTAVAALWGAFSRQDLELAGAQFALSQPAELPAFVARFTGDESTREDKLSSNLWVGPTI